MNKIFKLSIDELSHIANQLEQKVKAGLKEKNQEVPCLLTYVPIFKRPKSGRALVLDVGGTKARAAIISLEEGKFIVEKRTKNEKVPWKGCRNLTLENYLQFHLELISSLDPPDGIPLGYCFSYPTVSTPNGDAKLIEWTKEIFIPDIEGRLVGSMLIEYLHKNGIQCSKVTVINDTIASLLTGLIKNNADFYIGLIVGTGTNMATIMEPKMVPKLKEENPDWADQIPVNLESGNFFPPYLTVWDNEVDGASENPGKHRFEKAVSGLYLGHLFKAVFPNCDFDPRAGSKGLVKLAYGSRDCCDGHQVETARRILERSAKLVAASLAGLIKVLNFSQTQKTVNIIAEGGLISDNRSEYGELTISTLQILLNNLGMSDTTVNFNCEPKDTNFKGAALAVLA